MPEPTPWYQLLMDIAARLDAGARPHIEEYDDDFVWLDFGEHYGRSTRCKVLRDRIIFDRVDMEVHQLPEARFVLLIDDIQEPTP